MAAWPWASYVAPLSLSLPRSWPGSALGVRHEDCSAPRPRGRQLTPQLQAAPAVQSMLSPCSAHPRSEDVKEMRTGLWWGPSAALRFMGPKSDP